MGGLKRSLNLVGPGQGQRPLVFLFYTIYNRFENIIHIVLQYENSENNMHCDYTGVDPGMSNMGDIMSTPQPLFPSYHLLYSLDGVKIKSPHMRPLSQVVHRGPQYNVISPRKIETHDLVMIIYTHTYIIKHSHHMAQLSNSSIKIHVHLYIIIRKPTTDFLG